VGYHVYLRHGTSVCWHSKTRLESGPVTADLTTSVVHGSKLLINDVKSDHSLLLLGNALGIKALGHYSFKLDVNPMSLVHGALCNESKCST